MGDGSEVFPWKSRLVLALGKRALSVLGRTWRFRVVNEQALLNLRRARKPFIFSLWHGHLLPLLWHH
ncbi:MAG TPA: hypothetical protein VNO75_04965, partial [Gemmatimonadaceae bacterium]|nr:hypothetical protein [Gemmatimonadaceae bacterium]